MNCDKQQPFNFNLNLFKQIDQKVDNNWNDN